MGIILFLTPETATVIKTSAPVQTWTKPKLVKLGELKDVAGPAGAGSQAAGGGQFRS